MMYLVVFIIVLALMANTVNSGVISDDTEQHGSKRRKMNVFDDSDSSDGGGKAAKKKKKSKKGKRGKSMLATDAPTTTVGSGYGSVGGSGCDEQKTCASLGFGDGE